MHTAAKRGSKEIVELLSNKGADINTINNDSETPLHLAVQGGNEDVVRWLLTRGANTEIKNKMNKTPEDLAILAQRNDILQLFQLNKVMNAKTFDLQSPVNTLESSMHFLSNILQASDKFKKSGKS